MNSFSVRRFLVLLIFFICFLGSFGAKAELSEIKSEYNVALSWQDIVDKYDYKTPSAMIGFDRSWGFYYTDYLIPSFSLRMDSDLVYFGQFKASLVMGIGFDWALTKLRPFTKVYMGSGLERRRFRDGDALTGAFYVIGINQQIIYFNKAREAYLFSVFLEASPTSDLNGLSIGLQIGQGAYKR